MAEGVDTSLEKSLEGLATGAAIEVLGARLETQIAKQGKDLTNQVWKIVLVGVALVGGFIAYATNLILSAGAG